MEMTEQEWWDTYGDIQDRVWLYDEYLERTVRAGYLEEMVEFLFKPRGRVLDFGCGSGWVGLRLAEQEMQLDGLDISMEQIQRAKQQAEEKGITNARFFQGGVETIKQLSSYNSIIVHALFHHLSQTEKKTLLHGIAALLVDGGRAYFYEPIAPKPGSDVVGRALDKVVLYMLWLLSRLAYWLHLQEAEVREAIQAGWTMQSPEEAPIDLEEFVAMLPPELTVVGITYWHMCTVAYASLCMGMKPRWRRLAERGVVLFRWLDRAILHSRYRSYMQAWSMASIMLVNSR